MGQVCAPDGAAFRCQDVLDCPDGVDNDGDGMTDEDACDAPPDVKCPEPGTFPPFDLVTLAATASGAHPLIAREFELAAAPSTAFPTWLVEDHAGTAFLLPMLSGPYVTRFTAVDALRQARACLATTTMDTGGDLRVELDWTGDLSARLRPHLLSAEARWWFDPAQDCEVGGACTAGLPWDTGGGGGDPTADAELPAPGPEVVHVAHPTPGARYRVGVHVFASHGSTAARVRISCGGHLARELGPVVLGPGEEGAPGNAFWKVADVAFSAPSCDVSPLGDGLQVTTTASAAQAR